MPVNPAIWMWSTNYRMPLHFDVPKPRTILCRRWNQFREDLCEESKYSCSHSLAKRIPKSTVLHLPALLIAVVLNAANRPVAEKRVNEEANGRPAVSVVVERPWHRHKTKTNAEAAVSGVVEAAWRRIWTRGPAEAAVFVVDGALGRPYHPH